MAGILLLTVLSLMLLPAKSQGANPELAAAGSLFIPGLGQAANGNYVEGGAHLGLWLVVWRQYGILSEKDDFIEFEDRLDQDERLIRTNRTTFSADLYATAGSNLAFYSAFGAYRDARLQRGNRGYSTPAPTESLAELALAPFNWDYLKRFTTYVPVLISAYVASLPADRERWLISREDSLGRDEMALGFAAQHEMVAVGEESLFRGVLNNSLSSSLGNTWGLVSSSALFGLAHDGTGGRATPFAAAAFGAYTGYLHQRNGFRIGEGVALHFWWNFLISLGMLQDREPEEETTLASFRIQF